MAGKTDGSTAGRLLRDANLIAGEAAAWEASSDEEVRHGLAGVLLKAVECEFVHVSAHSSSQLLEVCATPEGFLTPDEAIERGKALRGLNTVGGPPGGAAVKSGTLDDVNIALVPLGGEGWAGVMALGSRTVGFPSPEDRLLMVMAANQATVAMLHHHAASDAGEGHTRVLDEAREANSALLISALEADRQAEEARQMRLALYALLEGLLQGMLVLDPAGRVLFANTAARLMTGVTGDVVELDELRHLKFERLDGSNLPLHRWPISRALRGERFDDEQVTVRDDGAERQISFSSSIALDRDGKLSAAVLTCRDVTASHALDEVRREDIALVSHDLRNPLSVIMSAARQLRAGVSGDIRVDSLGELIGSNAERMLKIVEDLLESAQLEAGGEDIPKEPIALGPLVNSMINQMFQGSEASDRVKLKVTRASTLVMGDPSRIERVVVNLISNALKYSTPGTTVNVSVVSTPDEVRVAVQDESDGIAPEDVPNLFQKFYRGRSALRAPGNGLGLHIALLVARAHGGTIEMESEAGVGSTFTLVLPASTAPDEA